MRSTFRKYFLITLSLITFGIQNFLSALEFEIADLGLLETDQSQPYCINDKGQVCGIYKFQEEWHYFLWDPNDGLSCLNLPKEVTPIKINNSGQIIGKLRTNNGYERGFFWDPVTGFTDIGTLGGSRTYVNDINDHGQVVGYSYTGTDQNHEIHAFIWEDGLMKDLGTLSGGLCLHGTHSAATGINNNGIIVGYSNYSVLHKGKKQPTKIQAVLWNNGKIQQLDIPNSKFYNPTEAVAVNNLMQVLYTSEGKCYLRDLPSGKDFELPHSGFEKSKITDNNVILNQQWVMLDCNDRSSESYRTTPSPNIENSIWKSIEGHKDVNNSNWIVGVGSTIYGEHHAILLRPKN